MSQRKAILYRMVLPDHVCPYGARARQMLEQCEFEIDDRILRTRMEVDAFKRQERVDTTPQVFIDGRRIGGCDELAAYLEAASANS
jgi:glutaredoxin 3